MQKMHKTYAGTGSVCTGVAAFIPGTVINEFVSLETLTRQRLRIGHPGGVMSVEVKVQENNGEFIVEKAAFGRTARRLMDGYAYLKMK